MRGISKRGIRGAALLLALAALSGAGRAVASEPMALDLETVLRLGLERNLELKAQRADLESSRWGKRASNLAFLPTGAFTSSVTRVDDNTYAQANQAQEGLVRLFEGLSGLPGFPDFSGVRIDPFLYKDTYRSSISVNQEFPLNLHLLAGRRLAVAGERASRAGLDAGRESLRLTLEAAYFRLLSARELLAVAEEGLASAENRRLLAVEREDLGLIGRDERLRWDVALAQAKSDRVAAASGVALAEMDVNRLLDQDLGIALDPAQVTEASMDGAIALAELGPDELGRMARRDSPQASALRAASGAAAAGKLLAFSALTPSLHFAYVTGWRENDTVALDDYRSWSATALLQVPLLDLVSDTARYRQAAAEQRRSEYETARGFDQLELAARAAWYEVQRARESLEHRRTAGEQAQESFDIMQDRYELGHISEFDLVDVQVALTAAKAQAVAARYDYYLALAALESLLGAGGAESAKEE